MGCALHASARPCAPHWEVTRLGQPAVVAGTSFLRQREDAGTGDGSGDWRRERLSAPNSLRSLLLPRLASSPSPPPPGCVRSAPAPGPGAVQALRAAELRLLPLLGRAARWPPGASPDFPSGGRAAAPEPPVRRHRERDLQTPPQRFLSTPFWLCPWRKWSVASGYHYFFALIRGARIQLLPCGA